MREEEDVLCVIVRLSSQIAFACLPSTGRLTRVNSFQNAQPLKILEWQLELLDLSISGGDGRPWGLQSGHARMRWVGTRQYGAFAPTR